MFVSVISKLKLCSSQKQIYQIHGFLISSGLLNNSHYFILSSVIETCSKFNLLQYGYSIFNQISQPNIYLYNTMIKSLASHHSSSLESIFLFAKIRVVGLFPDKYSYPFVLNATSRLCDGLNGRIVHGLIVKSGFELNVHVAIGLVKMYTSCGVLRDARKVFDEMSKTNNVALWNAMVKGYAGNGEIDNAMELFERMIERDVISWTTMISGFVHGDDPVAAIEIFQRMRVEGVEFDQVALLAALSACADLGALELGEWIYDFVEACGMCRSIRLDNAFVDMYVKAGSIDKALRVFESMEEKSVVSWTTMIVGLAFHGLGKEALEMFSRMVGEGCKPNEVTFVGILSACSHVGLVELGYSYFMSMSSEYGITPNVQHFGCIVDLLGRVGYLKDAEDLVMAMPFDANAAIWGSLLAAARMHQDSALAAKALQKLLVLEPHNSGNYALLSNTYASAGFWSEARVARKTMRSSGVKKLPGESSIEFDNCIRSFVSGVLSYPEANEIRDILWEINQQCTSENHQQTEEEYMLVG